MNPRMVLGVGVLVVVGGLTAAGQMTKDDDDSPSRRISALEAACDLLADGETPDGAYAVLVDVLEDKSYSVPNPEATARTSVDRAVAGEC